VWRETKLAALFCLLARHRYQQCHINNNWPVSASVQNEGVTRLGDCSMANTVVTQLFYAEHLLMVPVEAFIM
jgi:hypothetical protein